MITPERFQTAINIAHANTVDTAVKTFLESIDQDNFSRALKQWRKADKKMTSRVLNELIGNDDYDSIRTFNTLYLALGEA